MANLNKVFLIGNLTRDPELRYTPSGTAIAEFGLAVNRTFSSGQGGEKREEVVFVDIVAWARQAEVIAEYKHKGDSIFLEGRLQLDQWEGKDGQKRSRMRVVAENFQFLGSPSGRGGAPREGGAPAGAARPQSRYPARGGYNAPPRPPAQEEEPPPPDNDVPNDGPGPSDDDIPF